MSCDYCNGNGGDYTHLKDSGVSVHYHFSRHGSYWTDWHGNRMTDYDLMEWTDCDNCGGSGLSTEEYEEEFGCDM